MFLEAPGWVIIKIHPPGACTFSEKKVLKEKKNNNNLVRGLKMKKNKNKNYLRMLRPFCV